ncbi:MAG: hypothetical protein LWW85_02145 [Marinilabiliales bacterium]|nr:hypothetical protein [Marinilabiliales bacterium]
MGTFLNINLDRPTPTKFIWKHFLFTLLWTIGILVFFFRVDVVLLNKYNITIEWLEGTLPIAILILIGLVMLTQKWYYSLALFLYPFLAFAWFIPKVVLSRGKIYLFLNYLTFIFNKFKCFKRTLLHFGLFTLAFMLLVIVSDSWTKWFAVGVVAYFYLTFLLHYIRQSFRPATLFGISIETFIDDLLTKGKQNESILINSFIVKTGGDSNSEDETKNKNLTRLIMINFALDTIVSRLNGFRGKRAYAISLMYELFIFLLSSILFFWFVNYELYQISPSNFVTIGTPSSFEVLYYSIKNIAFGSIDAIKPLSWIAKSVELFSYLVIGILLFVIVVSVIFSLRNEKINENIKLTTTLCQDQNRIVQEYVIKTYGKDIQSAVTEVANIKKSLQQLSDIINKLF